MPRDLAPSHPCPSCLAAGDCPLSPLFQWVLTLPPQTSGPPTAQMSSERPRVGTSRGLNEIRPPKCFPRGLPAVGSGGADVTGRSPFPEPPQSGQVSRGSQSEVWGEVGEGSRNSSGSEHGPRSFGARSKAQLCADAARPSPFVSDAGVATCPPRAVWVQAHADSPCRRGAWPA